MTKIYRRDNTVQYLGYFLVEFEGYEYIFHKYSTAMSFCWEHDLDPNKALQTNSPEIWKKCKDLAKQRMIDIDVYRNSLKAFFQKSCSKTHSLAEQRDQYEENYKKGIARSIMDQVNYELAQEAVIKQIGVGDGAYECMHILDTYYDEYFGIVYMCDKWSKK